MQKRVFLIHGYCGTPDEGWLPWLATQLNARGWRAMVPPMPDPAEPRMALWLSYLSDIVGHCDDDTYFVGHALGCQAILRYLQAQLPPVRVGGAVFVAGFEHLSVNAMDSEAQRMLAPWLDIPMHWESIRGRSEHFTAIFSDNDDWVPLSNVNAFATKLEASTMVLHDRGHFNPSIMSQLPEALDVLIEMVG